jgi:TonB-dependent receptor
VLGNTASGMDNRGGVSRTRSFDYSLFASELFNRVTVQKSYAAEQDEGGIAGTVGLHTAQPFDYPGFKLALSAKGLENSATRTLNPRLAALVSDRWGDFGALVSAAYGVSDSNEFGYRNFNWAQIHINPANIGPGVSAADAARLTATDSSRVFAPQADTLSTWYDHRIRFGATLSLQYDPGDRLTLGFDALYSRLSNRRNNYALAASGTNSLTGDITGTQVLQSDVIQGDSLVAARYAGVDLRSEFNVENDTTQFHQVSANAAYRASDRLLVKGQVGYSRSDYRLPVFDKVFLEAKNQPFGFDDRPDVPVNSYGPGVVDPTQWNLMRLDTQENGISSQYATAKLDAELEFAGGVVKGGFEYKRFVNSGYQRSDKEFHNVPADLPIPAGLKRLVPYDTLSPYIVGDVDGTYAFVGQTRDLGSQFTVPGTDYTVTEETRAAYLQYDLETEVGGRRLRADAGLRYYQTDVTSRGALNTGAGLQPVLIRHAYDGALPAFNLALDVRDGLVARLGADRDISRPALSDLAAAGSLTTAPFGGTISTGNPNLKPFSSDAIELSLEAYQGRVGFASIGLFYKRLSGFITTETKVAPYSTTGFPLSFLLPGQDGSILYNVSRPVNGPGADIKGVEIAVQRDLDFLPAPFDHLGVVANVTYAAGRSDVLIDGKTYALDLFQLSRWSSNATIYYETEKWGARISSAYRSGYLDGAGSDGNVGSGYRGANNIDVAAHYNVAPRLRIVAEGVNLTDQPIVQYADVHAHRLLAETTSGRTFTLGFSYEF